MIIKLGPFPKSISGPQKALAHIILPFPTGDSTLTSKSQVSLSQACILLLNIILNTFLEFILESSLPSQHVPLIEL